MISISRILVPTVLSPACGWAAWYSEKLAQRLGSKLVFLHVGACSREQIDAFVSSRLAGAPHEVLIREGEPADVIVQVAGELGIDLILMPTHAHGRFRRFLLGSVTAKVLHDANCPVLTGVHQEDLPASRLADFRSLVCAVDADETFGPVVRFASDLAALLSATLTMVHAIPVADETSDNRGEKEIRRYMFQRAHERFAVLCKESNVSLKVLSAGGRVERVVREAALRENADLMVIGRGHTLQELGRLRTHAYAIIRNSPCPVVSV